MKRKILLTSILTIVLCASLIIGSSLALLTSTTVINIAIGSGKVNLTANLENLKLFSMDEPQVGHFANGGTATIENGLLDIKLFTPGDKVTAEIKVQNDSTVNLKYRVVMKIEGELAPALVSSVTIDGKEYPIGVGKSATPWTWVASKSAIPANGEPIGISVALPVDVENEYQNLHTSISITLEAVQGNAELWDGSTDTAWYDNDPTASVFEIKTAQELAGIASVLSKSAVAFDGKTIQIMNNIDLSGHDWTPITTWSDPVPSITIEGNNKIISGLTVNGSAKGGFIGSNSANLTIRNLTFENADVSATNHSAVVVGYQYGNVTMENVHVVGSTVAGTGIGLGGLVGMSSQHDGATLKLSGCSVKDTVITGIHSIGALVGVTKSDDASKMEVKDCVSEAELIYSATGGVGGHQIAAGLDGYQDAAFTGDNNTENSKVLQKDENVIYTAKDLFDLAARVNGGDTLEGKTVLLANDIDLHEMAWTPIGSGSARFMGTFDGQGHTIRNLDVTCTEYGGLFGRVFKGTVKNVNLENVVIYSGFTAGAIAANVYGDVTGCSVKNAHIVCYDLNPDIETGKGDNVGGLIGYIADEGVGSEVYGNSVTDTFVSGNRDLGQLIGYAGDGVAVTGNLVDNVRVTCNGYTTNYDSIDDLRIGGLVGNRD